MNEPSRPSSSRIAPLLVIGAGVLILIGLVVWAILSSQPRLPAMQPTSPLSNEIGIPAAEIPRVPLAEAKTAYDDKTAFFVDVRDSGSYADSHIPGAVNISLATLENHLNEIPTDQWIITYCTWPAENSSARAAQILVSHGYKKVTPIKGGLEAWINAGYPVEP